MKPIERENSSHINEIESKNYVALEARLVAGLDGHEAELVKEAFTWTRELFGNRLRKDGVTPAWRHSYDVGIILVEEFKLTDYRFRVAGLLHDVVEDCGVELAEIEVKYGRDVALWVDGVTNFKKSNGEDDDFLTKVKLMSRSYVSPPVAMIKLADRLHNMRTLVSLSKAKQEEKAKETRDIYVHLAEAYGLWNVKVELEDLAFLYLMPDRFERRLNEIKNDPRENRQFRAYVKSKVKTVLGQQYPFEIKERDKGVWRTESKAIFSGIEAVNDLFKIRVIVDEDKERGLTAEQVRALAVDAIQAHFNDQVLYNLEDDYIYGNERPNGYSAVQLTVDVNGQLVEISVATKNDEEYNEWGIVALLREKREWRGHLLAPVVIIKRNGEGTDPQARAVFMNPDATLVDLAYQANPEKAMYLTGVCVNDQEMEITQLVEAGAVVEFLYDMDTPAVSEEWKQYCQPETARLIDQQLDKQNNEYVVWCGRDMLNRALQDRGIMNVSDLGENHIRSFIGAFGEVGDVLINPRLSLNGLDYVCWAMAKGIFLPDKVAENLDRAGITKEELKSTTIWVEGKQDQPGILRKLVGIVGEVASNKTIATVHNEVRENGGYGIRLVVRDLTPAEELALERMLSGEDERGFSQGFFSDYRVFRGTKVVIEEPGELGSESYVG